MPRPSSVYLAGPMSGLPEFNYPAFTEAAAFLRSLGYKVFNPAENHGGRTDLDLIDYFREDLPQVMDAEGIAVLPGWQNSKGAQIEVMLATHLGKTLIDATTAETLSPPEDESVLEEAQRLVGGDRQSAYGHPLDDFTRTGRIWGALLGIPDIAPEVVSVMMIGVKISREMNAHKRDNLTDAAGYALTTDMVHSERQRRAYKRGPGQVTSAPLAEASRRSQEVTREFAAEAYRHGHRSFAVAQACPDCSRRTGPDPEDREVC